MKKIISVILILAALIFAIMSFSGCDGLISSGKVPDDCEIHACPDSSSDTTIIDSVKIDTSKAIW